VRARGYLFILIGLILLVTTISNFVSGWKHFEEFFFSRPEKPTLSLSLCFLGIGVRIISINAKLLLCSYIATIYTIANFFVYLVHGEVFFLLMIIIIMSLYIKVNFFRKASPSMISIVTRNHSELKKVAIGVLVGLIGWSVIELFSKPMTNIRDVFGAANDWSLAWYCFVFALLVWYSSTRWLVSDEQRQAAKS
jgi:hypothetical protein